MLKQIHRPLVDQVASLSKKRVLDALSKGGGRKEQAAILKVSLRALRLFFKEQLSCYVPPGRSKPYMDKYHVFDDGRIWSTKILAFLKQFPAGSDYLYVDINGEKIGIHRIVLTVFRRPPRGKEHGLHKDGDMYNNRLSNLYWGTAKQNMEDRERHGNTPRGETSAVSKLTDREVRILRKRYWAGEKDIIRRFARSRGMSRNTIRAAIKKKTWKHVT